MKNTKRKTTNDINHVEISNKLSSILNIFLSYFPSFIPLVRNTVFHFGEGNARTLGTFTYENFENAVFNIFLPVDKIIAFSPTAPWKSEENLFTTILHEYLHIIFYHFDFPVDARTETQFHKFQYACEYVLDRFIVEEAINEIITPQSFYYSFIQIFEENISEYREIPAKYLDPWEIYQHISDESLAKIEKVFPNTIGCAFWTNSENKSWGNKNVGGNNIVKIARKNFYKDINYIKPTFSIVPENIYKWKEVVEKIEAEINKWDWSELDEETISLVNYTPIVPYHPKRSNNTTNQIVLIIDVSSSMSYQEILTGIMVIATKYTIKKVITHSIKILQILDYDQIFDEHLKTGGDTSYTEVFNYVLQNYPNDIKIHITDGWCFEPMELPKDLVDNYIFLFTHVPKNPWAKYKHIMFNEAKSISNGF